MVSGDTGHRSERCGRQGGAMLRYDPNHDPPAREWLAVDEADRIEGSCAATAGPASGSRTCGCTR
jgi:hypothetical protein